MPHPVPVHATPAESPFEPVAAERIVAGSPHVRYRSDYASPDGKFDAGVWESTVGSWRIQYDETEFCTLIEGQAALEDAAGHKARFSAGDSFVIPAGFAGVWHSETPVRKLYVISLP